MSDSMLAVHDAVFDLLTTGAAPLSVPVFDHVPANQAKPYVSIDRHIVDADDTSLNYGTLHLMFLGVWSEHKGNQEVLSLLVELHGLLHDQPLALAVGRAVSMRVDDRQTDLEPDGETYQGAVRLRILTEQE